jgi:hypothetical protein
MATKEELTKYIQLALSAHVNLAVEQIFEADISLSQLMFASDRLVNSLDLMEVFARVANGLRKDYGLTVRLPAFPLETPVSTVMDALLSETLQPSAGAIDAAIFA